MPVYRWTLTAAPNGDSDPTINWTEGMAPSAVNDSGRAMLAALAQYNGDISGSLVTTGTSTQYALSTNSNFTSAAFLSGQMICFVPHATNGAGPVTMSIDGAGANIPLRSSPNVELPSGVLVQGTPYAVTFNKSDGALYLHGFFGNIGVPLGVGMDYWLPTAPSSQFAFPFGQAISRTTYATLFAAMGTMFGPGDGSTTFNLPDKRGRVSVALDTMGGTASGRVTAAASGIDGTTVGANGGAQNINIARSGLPNVAPTFAGTAGTVTVSGALTASQDQGNFQSGTAGNPATFSPNVSVEFSASGTFTPQGTVQSLNGGVTQTPTIIMPPAIIVPYIMRII